MQNQDLLTQMVRSTLAQVRRVVALAGVNRAALADIQAILGRLAARRDLLTCERFALPPGQISVLHTLGTDMECGCTLYANRSDGGLASPPHDHNTWAVIAAVHGTEFNRLYRRETLADGSERVSAGREIALKEGASIALMPQDVHSIRVEPGTRLLNLHLYGAAMDRQSGRRRFDAQGRDSGHYAPQPLIL